MTKKYHLRLFIPILIFTSALLVYLIYQYKPLFPDSYKYETATKNKTFHITTYPDDPTFGNIQANNTIILFEDYNCSECKKHLTYFQNLLKKYPNEIKVIWKNILLNNFDENKKILHTYAYCTSKQEQFWTFQLFAYENENNLSTSTLNAIVNKLDLNNKKFEKCLSSQETSDYIQKNQIVAQLLNLKTLPTIFLNNKQIYSTEELTTELNNLFDQK